MNDFNQVNIDDKIAEIKAMSPQDRAPIVADIKADLNGWLHNNFNISPGVDTTIQRLDPTIMEEWGNSCAIALDNDNWTLEVDWPGEPPNEPTAFCGKPKQEVSGGGTYDPHTGTWDYSVKKKVTVTFEF